MSYCLSRTIALIEILKEGLEHARWAVRNLEKGTVYYKIRNGKPYAYKRIGSGRSRHDIHIPDQDVYPKLLELNQRKQAERDLRINWVTLFRLGEVCRRKLKQEYRYLVSKYEEIPHESMNPFKREALIHRTARGEMVRSKSEVIIANALHAAKIDYYYEFPYITEEGNGRIYYPDFTIPISIQGRTVYWEHCGYIQDAEYAASWMKKKIRLQEEGILENVNMIVTYDSYHGIIDSQEIQRIIHQWFLPSE